MYRSKPCSCRAPHVKHTTPMSSWLHLHATHLLLLLKLLGVIFREAGRVVWP
jgi:hypothetical protein